MANKLFKIINGVAYDVMLQSKYRIADGVAEAFEEGDLKIIDGVAYPILRDAAPFMGIRTSGGNMTAIYSYNNTLLNNPVISIIGSSHSVSYGLSGSQTLQAKIQAYFDTNHGGCTIQNLGVPGEYTDHWLPTAQGGLPDRNIDAALAFNPDIVLIIGPTNDATVNTPAQALANLQVIYDYARQHGALPFIHSPLPRGDFNATDQADLAAEDLLWRAAFTYKYVDLFNSVLRNAGAATAAVPNPAYFQGDLIHLNDSGTTVQANAIIKLLERELRANTAYLFFEIERSANGISGWALFDTIADQQTIKKTYPLQAGYYRIRARLKNNTYTTYSNIVTVAAGSNQSPTTSAGNDQDLDFGSTAVNLSGSGTDPDGTITGFAWSLVSGPNTPTIVSPNSQNTAVTGLLGGVYVFRLTVTDNDGDTASDDVRVRVVSKIMRVILSKTAAATVPAGWNNLAADPVSGSPSKTDEVGSTGFIFRSRGEANFNHSIGPSNAQNDWGQSTDLGSGFFQAWPGAAVANYWYNPFDNFVTDKYQVEFAALDPNKDTRLKLIGSRSNANIATGPFSSRYNVKWAAGNQQYDILATFQNTATGIIGEGRPLADGTLPIAFNIGATGIVAHLNALTIEQF